MVTANEITLVARKEEDRNLILIAFYPTGGFGDYIISSKVLDELLTYGNCRIDVYCENMTFGKAIYGDRPGVSVLPYAAYEKSRFIYDLSLKVEHFIHVLECNAPHIAKISPEWMDQVDLLGRSISHIRPDIGQQWFRENVHFKRCQLKGLNRWTELRHGTVFQISDQRTGIYLHKEYLECLQKLGLENKNYITINRGADSMGRSTLQTKVWPEEYYVEFLKLFHKKYSNITVVQLGSKSNTKIKGVDLYALGEDFEVVKWILKRSILHLDCEGGLVHLATQLSTKCIVIFGPTPMHFYSYPQNINLVSEKCHNCMGTHSDWAFSCFRGMKEPECMYSVTADKVMEKIDDYFRKEGKEDILEPELEEKQITIIKIEKEKLEVEKGELENLWQEVFRKSSLSTYDMGKEKLYGVVFSRIYRKQKYQKIAIINGKRDWVAGLLGSGGHQVVIFDRDFGYERSGDVKHVNYMRDCRKSGVDTRLCCEWNLPYENEQFDCVIYFGKCDSKEEIVRVMKTEGILITANE